jgi:diaminopimelate decarboxylase
MRLSAPAAAYGTPAFILDEADVRYRCRSYLAALPGIEAAYAGEAFLCRAMAQWIAAEGLSLGVCSAGELAVAQAVNFPAERIILHGHSMASDHNLVGRPPVIAVSNGGSRTLIRQETTSDLLIRDVGL